MSFVCASALKRRLGQPGYESLRKTSTRCSIKLLSLKGGKNNLAIDKTRTPAAEA